MEKQTKKRVTVTLDERALESIELLKADIYSRELLKITTSDLVSKAIELLRRESIKE